MNNFWNGKSIETVTRDYLCAALEECAGMQPMNIDGMVEYMCGNITIRNNAKTFVADYFNEAVEAVRACAPDDTFRISQYEKTANMMISNVAKELLSECPIVREYDDTYHIWKQNDIERLKVELYSAPTRSTPFQRAVDLKFESLESYSYRFLDYILKTMDGQSVNLQELANDLPLPRLSDQDARNFIKSNFDEAMRLLDAFRDSGYRVDYTNPAEMIQGILYQQEKEILADNPYLVDLVEYDGIKTIKLDEDSIEDLLDSLSKQRANVKLAKFDEMSTAPKSRWETPKNPGSTGKILDLRKSNNRCEILY